MRINLKVSFADKDKVKWLGAKWDIARKCWYITNQEDLRPFLPYMDLNPKLTQRKNK
jgi:hypothetical protein